MKLVDVLMIAIVDLLLLLLLCRNIAKILDF